MCPKKSRSSTEADYRKVVACVRSYYEAFHEVPKIREIVANTHLTKSVVGVHLKRMDREGLLNKRGKKGVYHEEGADVEIQTAPLLGDVSCGMRKLALEEFMGEIAVPMGRGINGKNHYFLRADGESMIDIGIYPGDFVLIRQQPTADPGEIVVALVGDEATLKRFMPNYEEGYVDLVPENEEMEVQRIDLTKGEELIIQGVAVRNVHVSEVH